MRALSIIVPVYNASAYLACCIESIISQTRDDWELILVDDGSTDGSLSIAQSYAHDSRIKVLTQHNSGPSVARNKGLAEASGQYITFVDADDWIDPDYVKIILGNAGDADIVFWGLKKIYPDNIRLASPADNYARDHQSVEILLQSLIVNPENVPYFGFTVTKLFKREIIEKYGLTFNPELRIKEDELFVWQYCSHINSLKALAFAPYNYRILQQSLSHNRKTFANYSLLANETEKATTWIRTDVLKGTARNMIFNYITGAVLESITGNNTPEAKNIVNRRLVPYLKSNKEVLTLPLWGRIASILPTDRLRSTFILNHLRQYSKRWKK